MKITTIKSLFSGKITVTILAKSNDFKAALAKYPNKCDVRHFSDVSVYSVKIRKSHFEQIVSDLNAKDLTLVGYVNTRNMYEIKETKSQS